MTGIGKQFTVSGAVASLDVAGALTRPLVRDVESLLQGGVRRLILNLTSLSRVDLCGLGTLLEIAALANRLHARLCIVCPEHRITLLIAVRILTLDISIFENSTDARRAFAFDQGEAVLGARDPEETAA
jgi:anti-anti-sigma regulatory factor